MGIMDWWSGRSDAGSSDQTKKSSSSATQNVWRGVFNPGSNPNVKNVGSSYYDTVKDKGSDPSTWDMILRSEETRRKSFSDLDTEQKGFIVKQDLEKVAGPKVDIGAIFAEADTNRDGKIDRKEFNAVLDKYFTGRR